MNGKTTSHAGDLADIAVQIADLANRAGAQRYQVIKAAMLLMYLPALETEPKFDLPIIRDTISDDDF